MQRFTLPRDLYHGKGALEALKSLKGKKAIVCVGGGSMKRFGFLDKAVGYLKDAGMEVQVLDGIESDPSVETVLKGAKTMMDFGPDWIVAIGGGSPIDAAKAMWIKYEYPDITFEDMCKVFGLLELRKKAHFCAISSTSGTATEVTAFSIITDYQKGIKYPIADFEITPDVAIVDPELAETMPQKLVAHTGMDAMEFKRARTEEQVMDRRKEILRACSEMYGREGFDGVTVKTIAERTSFSRPSIYNYYQTKEEILLDLLKQEYLEWSGDFLEGARKIRKNDAEAFCRLLTKAYGKHEYGYRPEDILLREEGSSLFAGYVK